MLRITIPGRPKLEFWDSKQKKFLYLPAVKEQTIQLEHSLVSISKWESKWCKSFLHTAKSNKMTDEETVDYIRCMTLTQNVPLEVYDNLTDENVKEIIEYINAPMTATTFSETKNGKVNNEIITSELIYYWMIAQNIPEKFEKWHLNRLLTLIRVCSIKNAPPKKTSKQQTISQYKALNAARRKKFNSKG